MDYDICDMRFINLNSSNATQNNGTFLSDVQFNFKNVLQEQSDVDYATVGILNAQFPVSFYTINYTNDTLIFTFGGNTYPIVVTRGNYNSNSLINELINKFTLVGFSMAIITNRITGIMSFTSASSIPFSFSGTSSIFPILGFVPGQNYNSVSSIITAPYPLNLLGIKRLRVNSYALSTRTFDSTTMGMTSCMASIPVNVASFGLIDYVNNSNAYAILTAKNVTFVDIQIVDENGNLINFNGINWTITIQLNIFRKAKKQNDTLEAALLTEIRDKIDESLDSKVDQKSDTTDEQQEETPDNSNPADYPTDPELELLLNN